jgi:hypothetical protein
MVAVAVVAAAAGMGVGWFVRCRYTRWGAAPAGRRGCVRPAQLWIGARQGPERGYGPIMRPRAALATAGAATLLVGACRPEGVGGHPAAGRGHG